LVAWKAGNLQQNEPFVDDLTSLIIGTEYNNQRTFSDVLAIVIARVKPICINYAMFVNAFATNSVKTARIRSWWYEEIARIDPAQRDSDPPCAYILVVNESSQRLFSSLTLGITVATITCSHVAMVYRCKTSIDSVYGFQTQSPKEIRKIVAWLLAKDRFRCPLNVREVSSKFHSCSIYVLTINLGVQVSICSN